MPEAYMDVESGQTTEKNEISGRIGFYYGGGEGSFIVPRVAVEMTYKDDDFLKWIITFPIDQVTLPEAMPLLQSLGTTTSEAINLPPDEHLEVRMEAKAEVLERLSPELAKQSKLSAMFQAGNAALLNLDNYQSGAVQEVEPDAEPLPEDVNPADH